MAQGHRFLSYGNSGVFDRWAKIGMKGALEEMAAHPDDMPRPREGLDVFARLAPNLSPSPPKPPLIFLLRKGGCCGIFVEGAIDAMPRDFITRPYLEAHRAEVKGMLLTEYNEAKAMELFKEEGRMEGRAEGRSEGMELFSSLVKRLLDLGRNEDVARVAADPSYRDKLIAELHEP